MTSGGGEFVTGGGGGYLPATGPEPLLPPVQLNGWRHQLPRGPARHPLTCSHRANLATGLQTPPCHRNITFRQL